MPNLRFTALLAAAALTVTVQARLLETVEECDTRYGPGRDLALELGDAFKSEAGKTWTAKIYSARGLAIQVVFEDNVAALIRYSNEPPIKVAESAAHPVNLTVDEIAQLRGVNLKEGISWQPYRDKTLAPVTPGMTFWKSSDQQSYASYDRDRRLLFVCSAAFWEIVAGNLRKQAESSAAMRFEGL